MKYFIIVYTWYKMLLKIKVLSLFALIDDFSLYNYTTGPLVNDFRNVFKSL